MKSLLECLIATVLAGMVVGSVLRHNNDEDNELGYNPHLHPSQSQGYRNLIQLLRGGHEEQPKADEESLPTKRFTDFTLPYMKYKVDKRTDGMWIWMPAQGYVSVPHQQEDQENALAQKQAKIMRYGRK